MLNEKFMFTCSTDYQNILCRFLQNIDSIHIKKQLEANVVINEILYQAELLCDEIVDIVRLIKSHWCSIQIIALNDDLIPYDEIIDSRNVIFEYMDLIKISLKACNDEDQKIRYLEDMFEDVKPLSNFIVPFHELEPDMLLKIAAFNMNNKKCPIYQYFHTNLEIQYHLLIVYYFSGNHLALESHIENITQNIITVCRKHYKRSGNEVFLCPCVKQLFMILQYIKEKTTGNGNNFWKIFNSALQNDDPLFSLFLLKELAEAEELLIKENYISDISTNFEFLETKLKYYLINAETNTIREVFKIIDVLVNRVWSKKAKIEAFQIIWDYYSKRLNISNKNYAKLSTLDIYKCQENILSSKENCKEDFEIFVSILTVHLKWHPEHWGKMKGRIYSQLGTNKLKELNETGIAHVGILFTALSTLFYDEMQKRILSFFDVLAKEKKDIPILWNIYMSFVYQELKNSRNIEKTAVGMRQMLQNASSDSKSFYFIRNFLLDFKHCVIHNQNMTLSQWMFYDLWLDKYLSTCSIQDLKTAVEVFLLILETLSNTDSWTLWKSVFKEYIYPPLKKISITFNAPEEIGKIAGLICIMDLELSELIFNTFTSDVSPKVSNQFLLTVLDDYRNKFVLSEMQKSLFVQSWIKICLLTGETCEELTSKFLNLDIFPQSLKSYIGTAKNPLYAMLEYLGSDIRNHLQSSDIYKICENSFGHIDKWLTQYLTHIDNEVTLFRIFTFISLAFFHCGRLIYNRSKISTPLTKLVDVILLPQDILLGRSPHNSVLNAIKQTWHVFFEALVNLNSDCDKYLERTLRDMITKYVPFFTVADSPFIKCLNNEKNATALLEKIAISYFKHPVKESDASILKILKMMKDIIESTTSLSLLKIIIDKTLYSILEFIILHPQRNAAFIVIKTITSSSLFSQCNTEFCNSVMAVSEKHLAHNTINYFQLLCVLAKFVPEEMKKLLGVIRQQVSNVERLRGVGFDKNLRMHFEKFESSINENI